MNRMTFWVRPAAIGFIVAALAMALVAGLNNLRGPQTLYRAAIDQAVAGGSLPAQYPALDGGTFAVPSFRGNDCLILGMIATPRYSGAMSEGTQLRGRDNCERMLEIAHDPNVVGVPYHRYIHGYSTLTALSLHVMTFAQLSSALFILNLVLAALVVGVAVWRGRTAVALLGIGALLFSGLYSFANSISFGFGDLALLGFLLFSAFGPLAENRRAVLASAIFGAAIAAFEFLTGHLPVAVCLIIFLFAVEYRSRDTLWLLARALVAFGAAFLSMFLIKMGYVAFSSPPQEVAAAGGRLLQWTAADYWAIAPENEAMLRSVGTSSDAIKDNRVLAFGYDIAKMVYNSPYILWSRALGAAIMIGIPGLLFAVAVWNGRARDPKWLLLAAPFVIIMGWHFVFISHGIVHSSFMSRTLAWLGVISLAGLYHAFTRSEAVALKLDRRPQLVGASD